MHIALDDRSQLARLTQLTQKTNQFNLTTRRYTEEQLGGMLASPHWLTASFSLADAFGDSGIVGLALIRRPRQEVAEIDTFLMSCRVIGRTAESAFLEALLDRLRADGVATVIADYLPTPKNRPVEDFLPNHRFAPRDDGRFVRALAEHPPLPRNAFPITVTFADPGAPAGVCERAPIPVRADLTP